MNSNNDKSKKNNKNSKKPEADYRRPYVTELQALLMQSMTKRHLSNPRLLVPQNSSASQNIAKKKPKKKVFPEEATSVGHLFNYGSTQKDLEKGARKFSKMALRNPSILSQKRMNQNNILYDDSRMPRFSIFTRHKLQMANPIPEEIPSSSKVQDKSRQKHANEINQNQDIILEDSDSDLDAMDNKEAGTKSHKISKDSNSNISSSGSSQTLRRPSRSTQRPSNDDQLNIPDCVGKAGCKTRGYMLRPPGVYMTRRVSEIKLKQIKEFSDIDDEKLDKLCYILKIISKLLMGSGTILCLFIIGISFSNASVDYLRQYLKNNVLSLLLLLGGISHPLITGFYCLYAFHKLSHLRPYILRIPFTLVIPIGLFSHFIQFTDTVTTEVDFYLRTRIQKYHQAEEFQRIIDDIQLSHSCCGITESSDWLLLANGSQPGTSDYPKSCCINQSEAGCPDFALVSSFHKDGCLKTLQDLNIGFGSVIIILSIVQFLLMVVSLILMKILHHLIKDEIDDPRPTCKIIMGRFYSICESAEYDRKQELAEKGELDFEDLFRTLPSYSQHNTLNANL